MQTPRLFTVNGKVDRERRHRERMNELDRQFWKDLAAKCLKIAEIEEPRKREMAVEAYFADMHGAPPEFLTRYLKEKQLPAVGEFDEVPKGVLQPEILWDNDDLGDQHREFWEGYDEFGNPTVEA